MCEIWQNGIDDLTYKAQTDTDAENKGMDTKGERGGKDDLGEGDWHIYTVNKTGKNENPLYSTRHSAQRSAVT